jgi:hypothetical protein
MIRTARPSVAALVFFAAFFLLFSSGRIASMDAGQQLQVSLMLALTGQMSAETSGVATHGWVRAPNGRYYQAHDIGNVVLMLPAAWAGAIVSGARSPGAILDPPVPSRVGAALSCSLLAAFGCWWLFRLFLLFYPARTSFLLAWLFPWTTIFFAYARAGWDVLGGCCFVCATLYYSIAFLRDRNPARDLMMMSVMLAAACSFRFSLAPFFVPACAALVFSARRTVSWRAIASALVVFLLLVAPTLVYNDVRTGSWLRPATAAPQYLAGANALTGNILHGLLGLFLSPNRGLLVFCPFLLFAVAASFEAAAELRRSLGYFAVAAFGYTLMIAKLYNWGAFGWGPRYLLPVLPIFFIPAACGLRRAFEHHRVIAVAAVLFCAVLTLPSALVNWHLATTAAVGAARSDARLPIQQYVAWKALVDGFRARPLPLPPDVTDPQRATTTVFPDLFVARLARQSRQGLAAALVMCIGTFTALVWSASMLLRSEPEGPLTRVSAHA